MSIRRKLANFPDFCKKVGKLTTNLDTKAIKCKSKKDKMKKVETTLLLEDLNMKVG